MTIKTLLAAAVLAACGTASAETVQVPAVAIAASAAAVVMPAGAPIDTIARITAVVGDDALAAADGRLAGDELQGYAQARITALSQSNDPASKAALARWEACVTNHCVGRLAARETYMLALHKATAQGDTVAGAVYLSRLNAMLAAQVSVQSLTLDEYRVAMTEAMYDAPDDALRTLVQGEPLYAVEE